MFASWVWTEIHFCEMRGHCISQWWMSDKNTRKCFNSKSNDLNAKRSVTSTGIITIASFLPQEPIKKLALKSAAVKKAPLPKEKTPVLPDFDTTPQRAPSLAATLDQKKQRVQTEKYRWCDGQRLATAGRWIDRCTLYWSHGEIQSHSSFKTSHTTYIYNINKMMI